jgi:hypothetical protein
MKVCVISPFIADGSSIRATLPASRQNILDFIGLVCKEYDFIVLAGYNVNCYPNERDVQSELKKNQSLATTFLETSGMKPQNYSPSNNAFFVSANTICDKPEQIFSKPKKVLPTVLDISILQKNLSQRFHFISNKKILLFICGEIDAFSKTTTMFIMAAHYLGNPLI